MKPFSILHISDLHRSRQDPISNAELISALISDRDRYLREEPAITAPEAIVVTGDVIQGVSLGTPDHEKKLSEQYVVAEEFLDELVKRFLNGDRSRLILVPGNHDIDWNTAFSALEVIRQQDAPANLATALYADNSDYRWDWKTLTLYRIADMAKYERRLEPFWKFFERFYRSATGLLDVRPGADANLFTLCDGRIGVAAYNSCHGNDCFAHHGWIRKDIVARSHLELMDSGKVFDLRMAVWHHSIEGPPYRTDYMDVDIVRGMIGRGFRLGLYGHHHKTHVAPHEVWLPDRERMAAVGVGSLCAGSTDLPTGVHRQYNILEIGDTFQSVRVHVRAMAVANLFSRGQLPHFGGKSFADLDWDAPRNPVGGSIQAESDRTRLTIAEAELAFKTGNPAHAIKLLGSVELQAGSYQRELLLMAAADAKDWSAIIGATKSPATIDELVRRVEAFSRLGRSSDALDALERFGKQLSLPDAAAGELRRRITAREAIRQ